MRKVLSVAILCLLSLPAFARGGGHGGGHSSHSSSGSRTVHVREHVTKNGTVVHAYDRALPGDSTHSSSRASGFSRSADAPPVIASRSYSHADVPLLSPGTPIHRDRHGRIARSEASKEAFMRETGYTHGRKGYVVDHVIPLACGGADVPSNMQWQTKAEGKAKDKWERKGCGGRR